MRGSSLKIRIWQEITHARAIQIAPATMPPRAVETMCMMLVDGQIDHTDPIRADMINEAGTTASVEFGKGDLRDVFGAVSEELEKAETTVREWHDPDVWQLIGHEPPIADM